MNGISRRSVAIATSLCVAIGAALPAVAQQTLYRNALSPSGNTLTNVSGWSTSAIAAGATPTSVTSADTLVFSNYWTPGQLSGVNLWIDAADASSITTSSGTVSQWRDKSGSGNNMATGGGANPATYVDGTSASAINGLPVVATSSATPRIMATSGALLGTTFDVYSVSNGGNFAQYATFDNNRTVLYANLTGTSRMIGLAIGSSSQMSGTAGPSAPHVFGWSKTASSGSAQLLADGGTQFSGAFTGTPQNVGFSLGGFLYIPGTNFWAGTYAETIVTGSTNLVTSDRQLVEGYLAWKWGQTANLDAANPYKSAVPRATINTVYLGGNQTAAGLVFSGSASATTLLGGTSGGAAANTLAIGSGGISVSAVAADTLLGAASGGTVGLVLNASQSWTNNSAAVLRAFNGVSRATGDTTSRLLTIAGSGSTRIDGVIADGGASGSLALLKQDAGSLRLNGLNTFTGSTSITGGTLLLAAGSGLASPAISVGTGAAFDVSGLAGGFTLASGQSIGGLGSIVGNLVFGVGSQFAFSSSALQQLVLASGSASFASSFGVASVLGLGGSTVEGTYTLLSGAVDPTNLANVGAANAASIGGGKSAYFQQPSTGGSLQMVVVPEPGAVTLAGIGAAVAAWAAHRRRRRMRG